MDDKVIAQRVSEVVDKYIERVSENLEKHVKDERYKFDSFIKFRDNFNPNADDLVGMLESSLPNGNLVAGSNYFPRKMTLIFAKENPELTRQALTAIADSSKSTEECMRDYEKAAKELLRQHNEKSGRNDSGADDARFISLLMSFLRPNEIINYKARQIDAVYKYVYGQLMKFQGDRINRVLEASVFGRELLKELQSRPEFKEIKERLVPNMSGDNLWLAQDVYWVAAGVIKDNEVEKDGVRSLVSRFISHVDDGGLSRKEFSGHEISGLTSSAWVNIASKTGDNQLNVPYIMFGFKSKEKLTGKEWSSAHLGFLYDRINSKLYLAHGWDDGKDQAIGRGNIPNDMWHDFYKRAEYDPRDISDEIDYDFEKLATEYKAREEIEVVNNQQKLPLNTILYGPPGTGKTWHAKEVYAKNLLEHQAGQEMSPSEVMADYLRGLTWWQVVALALSRISHPIKVAELAKYPLIESYARYVRQRTSNINPTLWSTLQERSTPESSSVASKISGTEYFQKDQNSQWELTTDGREYVESDTELQAVPESTEAKSGTDWGRFYRTITFHQSYSYEEFVEGIRPKISDDDESSSEISYEIRDGIFKEMCKLAANDPNNDYLLIIDEINRGNIAKIFGELITLIENDKREKMSVILPYSQKPFTVPKNLYILGTMNTADRSISLLDIALRRRFDFIELMPKHDMPELNKEVVGVHLGRLLKTINDRISALLDRDHQIGHSYLMGVNTAEELHKAWGNKILPLIQEYFYGDWDRIAAIIGDGFIESREVIFPASADVDEVAVKSFRNITATELPDKLNSLVSDEQTTDS